MLHLNVKLWSHDFDRQVDEVFFYLIQNVIKQLIVFEYFP